MTREEAKATDPDATAVLLTELQNAASYLNASAASDKDGEPTAYGEIVGQQFDEAAYRFVTSDGRTLEDALAFAFAVRVMLTKVINSAVVSDTGEVDWHSLVYGAQVSERLYACLCRLSCKSISSERKH